MNIFETNFDEYRDPAAYDLENGPYLDDVEFLRRRAENLTGPIIDLCCGTGRATIPLAEQGHAVIGVDLHEGMLRRARDKTEGLGLAVRWEKQDCSRFVLEERSRLVYMVGNSFQHFLTNESQTDLLASVNRHLEPGGEFIFGTRFPNASELLMPPEEEYWRSYTLPEGNRVDVYTVCRYEALTQIQHCTTIRRTKDGSGRVLKEQTSDISLRFSFPRELERLFGETGFEVLNGYGDWQERPLTTDSHNMVFVLRKK